MFVVENRSAQALLPMIRKCVKPGTYVFTDKWMAYWDLRNGYEYFAVVPEKRFVQYRFYPNQVVIKVTTNHIERMWVEMRKDLRGVKKEEVEQRLPEVPYRLFRLWLARFADHEHALIADICAFVLDDHLAKADSPFRRAGTNEK